MNYIPVDFACAPDDIDQLNAEISRLDSESIVRLNEAHYTGLYQYSYLVDIEYVHLIPIISPFLSTRMHVFGKARIDQHINNLSFVGESAKPVL